MGQCKSVGLQGHHRIVLGMSQVFCCGVMFMRLCTALASASPAKLLYALYGLLAPLDETAAASNVFPVPTRSKSGKCTSFWTSIKYFLKSLFCF
jgi:hypothetical protein